MKNLLIIFLTVIFFLSSCKPEFQTIDYGHESCVHCKMTIIDNRFAAEILTKKGKAYKFDDVECVLNYVREEKIGQADVLVFVSNFSTPNSKFLNANEAIYIHNISFNTPMNGNLAAFPKEMARKLTDSFKQVPIGWKDLK